MIDGLVNFYKNKQIMEYSGKTKVGLAKMLPEKFQINGKAYRYVYNPNNFTKDGLLVEELDSNGVPIGIFLLEFDKVNDIVYGGKSPEKEKIDNAKIQHQSNSVKNENNIEEILQLSPPPIPESSEISKKKQDIEGLKNQKIINSEDKIAAYAWRRFFARTLDIFTSGTILLLFFSYLLSVFFPNIIEEYLVIIKNPFWAGILIYFLWIPAEAFYLYALGTTPAKWLFSISVKNKSNNNLDFHKALYRAFQVFVFGEGFAIPLITIFTRYLSFRKLKRTMTTDWDMNIGSIVIYKKWSGIKKVFSIIVSILVLLILIYINKEK